MRTKFALSLGLLTVAIGSPVLAQPPGPPPHHGPHGHRGEPPGPHDKLRGELLDQVRAMRVWMLTDELKLDEAQVAKVFPLLATFDAREQQLAHERGELHRTLREQIDATPPKPAELGRLTDAMLANRDKRHALEKDRLTALRKVLTPVQQAKAVLLWPRIEEMARHRIRSALGRGPDGKPDDGRPGPPDRHP